MSRSPLHGLLDAFASVLAPLTRGADALGRAPARLWRLASLRARLKDGAIPTTTQFDGPVQTAGGVRLTLGAHCRLGRDVFFETPGGSIRAGAHVRINRGTLIVSYASIEIGSDVLIGEYASIRDADHGMEVLSPPVPMRLQAHRAAPIRIEDGAWIARGVCVLKGVTIGAGAVVAANSVVTKDIPPMAIAGGIPARVLKFRGQHEDRAQAAEAVSHA
jgi:acetyltransferase-like isoleucine patch superfamily enzyme